VTGVQEMRWRASFGPTPWLVAFAGEAGSGKSTLSRAVGHRLGWPVVDKDDIKDILHGHTIEANAGGLAYDVMFNVARRQLLLGLSVICDSPLTGGAGHAAQVAAATGARLAVVACRCPDEAVWRDRINARKDLGLPGHHQTDWDTMRVHSRPDPLPLHASEAEAAGHPYLQIDTLAPVEALRDRVIAWLTRQAGQADGGSNPGGEA
jgi:predicted kinase